MKARRVGGPAYRRRYLPNCDRLVVDAPRTDDDLQSDSHVSDHREVVCADEMALGAIIPLDLNGEGQTFGADRVAYVPPLLVDLGPSTYAGINFTN